MTTGAEKQKTVSASATEQVHIVMPAHCNGCGRLFGGRLMEWIDVVAAVCARRHCERSVVTVCIDGLDFAAPAFIDEIVVLHARLSRVGNTSMEVRVDSYVENARGARTLINRAHLVMVALDDAGNPAPVPRLVLSSAQEEEEHRAAVARAALRAQRHTLGG
jgi:acyl-CoA hydrolase